jgi:hypothetical protein
MKPFSIYFPQFYPTPTNDRVWGKGFSDWSLLTGYNLRRTDSERRAPARGLYDGADPAVHKAQIGEMQSAGLGGLGLYHYWFYTHQELDAFETTILSANADVSIPWFLIWATESWSKRWLGDHTTIVDLDPDPDNTMIEAHCRHLARCFASPTYYRWQGRPLFVWYNLGHFRQPGRIVERYRTALATLGFDVAMANFVKHAADIDLCAFTDATYIFEPRMFFNMGRVDRGGLAKRAFDTATALLGRDTANRILVATETMSRRQGQVFSADSFVAYMRSDARAALLQAIVHPYQDVVSPGWDNRPRYQDRQFTTLDRLSPAQFGTLLAASASSSSASGLPPLINAWNEWTELAAIEPCAYLGTRYLDVVKPKPSV